MISLNKFMELTEEEKIKGFIDLGINDQITYINKCAEEGETLTQIFKRLHKQRTKYRDRFGGKGFKWDKKKKQFLKEITEEEEINSKQQVFMSDKMILDRLQAVEKKMEELENYISCNPTLSDIEIDEKISKDDFKTRSFRVSNKVLENFIEFCDNNKNFSKQDLMSQALKEFMDNHK